MVVFKKSEVARGYWFSIESRDLNLIVVWGLNSRIYCMERTFVSQGQCEWIISTAPRENHFFNPTLDEWNGIILILKNPGTNPKKRAVPGWIFNMELGENLFFFFFTWWKSWNLGASDGPDGIPLVSHWYPIAVFPFSHEISIFWWLDFHLKSAHPMNHCRLSVQVRGAIRWVGTFGSEIYGGWP